MPNPPFPNLRVLSGEIARATRQQQIEAQQAPPVVPQPEYVGQRFVEPPPPIVVPTAQPATNAATVGLLTQIAGLLTQQIAQNEALLRFQWMQLIASNTILPTRFEVPIPGSTGDGALYAFNPPAFTPFYTNRNQWPVAIAVRATWATPGGSLDFAYAPGASAIEATLANGGPTGGTFSSPMLVPSGQTIYMRLTPDVNTGIGTALTAKDTFFVGVMDFARYVKADAYQAKPY